MPGGQTGKAVLLPIHVTNDRILLYKKINIEKKGESEIKAYLFNEKKSQSLEE